MWSINPNNVSQKDANGYLIFQGHPTTFMRFLLPVKRRRFLNFIVSGVHRNTTQSIAGKVLKLVLLVNLSREQIGKLVSQANWLTQESQRRRIMLIDIKARFSMTGHTHFWRVGFVVSKRRHIAYSSRESFMCAHAHKMCFGFPPSTLSLIIPISQQWHLKWHHRMQQRTSHQE